MCGDSEIFCGIEYYSPIFGSKSFRCTLKENHEGRHDDGEHPGFSRDDVGEMKQVERSIKQRLAEK